MGKIKHKVLCSAMEGDCNGCVSQSCPAGERIVVAMQCVVEAHYDIRALRPTEASSTTENLNKRPKMQRGAAADRDTGFRTLREANVGHRQTWLGESESRLRSGLELILPGGGVHFK